MEKNNKKCTFQINGVVLIFVSKRNKNTKKKILIMTVSNVS